jgi:thiol-disulfide isomerase/thioredoxin
MSLSLKIAAALAAGLAVSAAAAPAQEPASAPSQAPLLAVGDTVPSFDAEGLDGAIQHVDYRKGSVTVVLFFLSSCPVCHKMIPEWNRAYERRPKGLRVVAVMLDREPPGFFMATPVSFPVLRSPGPEFPRTFKLQKVPMTVRIGAGGKVEDVGVGQLDLIRLGEIFRP